MAAGRTAEVRLAHHPSRLIWRMGAVFEPSNRSLHLIKMIELAVLRRATEKRRNTRQRGSTRTWTVGNVFHDANQIMGDVLAHARIFDE